MVLKNFNLLIFIEFACMWVSYNSVDACMV